MTHWEIPLSDLDLGEEERNAVTRVVDSNWLTLGSEVRSFEEAFAASCGTADAVAASNCTAALHLAFIALGVAPGDEVIVPSVTFVATANAVALAGGTPVFADSIGLEDLTIDPVHVAKLVTPRTVGVVAVHYGGFACRMDALMDLCRTRDLFLVEDVAHAPGGTWNGHSLGTLGDVGCFSFFGNKNLTTGEGGMVLARNPDVLQRIRLLRSHGMTSLSWDRFSGHASSYDVVSPGFNYRPTEFMGALGKVQLEKLPQGNRRRVELLRIYHERLSDVPGVVVPFRGRQGTGHLMVVALPDQATRDRVRTTLHEGGIQTSLHYPPVHLFQHYRETLGTGPGLLPVAEEWARTALTLPLYPGLGEAKVHRVCDVLEGALTQDEV